MIVGSICSGIEAFAVAAGLASVRADCPPKYKPLGWTQAFASEIEPFPSAVMHSHWPDVPNLGDFTTIKAADWPDVEMIVGGPPCQSFSIAGNRGGLSDDRGNLTLSYVEMCHDFQDNGSLRWAVYENVPGILSDKTNAFGCLISGLVGSDTPFTMPFGKDAGGASWPSAGLASGPRARLAWRVLDAQYCGLAQRRRRVLIVVGFAKGCDPAKVLFERQSLRGNTAPRRETGQRFAGDVGAGVKPSGPVVIDHAAFNQGVNAKFEPQIEETELMPSIVARGPHAVSCRMTAIGEYVADDTASTVKARDYKDATDLIAFSSKDNGRDAAVNLSPTMRASNADKSHANAGAPPAVAIRTSNTGANGHGIAKEAAHTLDGAQGQAVAFAQNTRDEVRYIGGDGSLVGALAAETGAKQQSYIAQPYTPDTAHTLRGEGFDASEDGTGRGTPLVAPEPYTLAIRGRGDGHNLEYRQDGTANAVLTPNGGRGGIGVGAFAAHYAVRRLTTVECARLQGFPDRHTLIAWRGKPAASCPDGPQYKCYGNSWAVSKFRWLFTRLDAVDRMARGLDVAPDHPAFVPDFAPAPFYISEVAPAAQEVSIARGAIREAL